MNIYIEALPMNLKLKNEMDDIKLLLIELELPLIYANFKSLNWYAGKIYYYYVN